jgi:hypothetical protein
MNFLLFPLNFPTFNQNYQHRQTPRKFMRINPLKFYSDFEFKKRYRFTKENFQFLCNEFEEDLGRRTNRHGALSTANQLYIALRFYVTGSFLEVVGDTAFKVSKSTVSQVIRDISCVLCHKLGIKSEHTVAEWKDFCREVCAKYL